MNPLETAFARMRDESTNAAPPADLRARCLDTIPAPRPRRRWAFAFAPRLSVACAVIVGLFFVATQPQKRDGNEEISASAAWAQSVAAMQKVRWWHSVGRMRDLDLPHDGNDRRIVKPLSWYPIEEWFDANSGIAEHTGPAPQQDAITGLYREYWNVYPSFGNRYERGVDMKTGKTTLKITPRKPQDWITERNSRLRNMNDFDMMLFKKPKDRVGFTTTFTMTNGVWKGKSVRIFTLTMAMTGTGFNRYVLYGDKKSRRIIGLQIFTKLQLYADLGEVLVKEEEHYYDERPDPKVFDPTSLKVGVDEMRHIRSPESRK